MGKKVKKPYNGGQWSKARYWGFIRSNLRMASRKWGPRIEALKMARRAYKGPNKRQKWEHQCKKCSKWFKATLVQVDHITPCGALTEFRHLPGFVKRMFCEVDGFQVLCKECHKGKP